jgi:AcrR family transcriptional regulator
MARSGLSPARVIEAAAVLADHDGYATLTLASVAAELGVRLPSLYNHVDGLYALRRALSVRACAELHDTLAEAIGGRSGDDALRAAARAYRAWGRAHPGLYAASQVAPRPDDAEHVAAATRVVDTLVAALREHALGRDRAIHAIRVIRASLHGFVQLELSGGFGLPLKVDESYDHLMDVLLAGLAATAADRAHARSRKA